jgi:hypothetical protein
MSARKTTLTVSTVILTERDNFEDDPKINKFNVNLAQSSSHLDPPGAVDVLLTFCADVSPSLGPFGMGPSEGWSDPLRPQHLREAPHKQIPASSLCCAFRFFGKIVDRKSFSPLGFRELNSGTLSVYCV